MVQVRTNLASRAKTPSPFEHANNEIEVVDACQTNGRMLSASATSVRAHPRAYVLREHVRGPNGEHLKVRNRELLIVGEQWHTVPEEMDSEKEIVVRADCSGRRNRGSTSQAPLTTLTVGSSCAASS